jgi:hypothetical protein
MFSEMWRRVDLVWTDVSEEHKNTSSTQRHITEDGILHSHHRENLKSYINNDYISALLTNLSFALEM